MRRLLTALPRRVWLPALVALAVVAATLGALLTGRDDAGPSTAAASPSADPAAATGPSPTPSSSAVPPAPAPAAPGPEGQVLALVDAERAAAGCGAVSADGGPAGVARADSADMRDRGCSSHTDPEGRSPFDRAEQAGAGNVRAENIAKGQPDADVGVWAWMDSPGHRQDVLNCEHRSMGLGVATGAGGPWWTQLSGV